MRLKRLEQLETLVAGVAVINGAARGRPPIVFDNGVV
jgi:hypothetical protein